MRTFQFILIALIVFSCQNTVKSQVPKEVQSNFESKYPGENDPDWETDSNGNYEAHFKKKGVKYRADFSPNGQWIETETNIDKDDLPKAIKQVIKEQYGSEDITEVELVDSATKGTFYDVEFKQKGKNMDVMFRANGEIIQ
ncbi:PepSY-like domain-containing protein [Olleya sp. YS]|uniref:PepSY-like domain-containing protein n=1 Tax=Olleya sp. YS TaxID=3028318 RepID=UPI0024341A8D|nr:PepSY-like domain-containing protein [Olleya sp. YS]WGD34517.1 PepSY-like domain-containing protein [Olleya sp. YS]